MDAGTTYPIIVDKEVVIGIGSCGVCIAVVDTLVMMVLLEVGVGKTVYVVVESLLVCGISKKYSLSFTSLSFKLKK